MRQNLITEIGILFKNNDIPVEIELISSPVVTIDGVDEYVVTDRGLSIDDLVVILKQKLDAGISKIYIFEFYSQKMNLPKRIKMIDTYWVRWYFKK